MTADEEVRDRRELMTTSVEIDTGKLKYT